MTEKPYHVRRQAGGNRNEKLGKAVRGGGSQEVTRQQVAAIRGHRDETTKSRRITSKQHRRSQVYDDDG